MFYSSQSSIKLDLDQLLYIFQSTNYNALKMHRKIHIHPTNYHLNHNRNVLWLFFDSNGVYGNDDSAAVGAITPKSFVGL